MAQLSLSQIVITSKVKASVQSSLKPVSGRCAVIDIVLPQLCREESPVKQKQTLNNIDSYMLEETALLLTKVAQLCQQITLYEGEYFKIETVNNNIQVSGTFTEQTLLLTVLKKDNWINGALAWLHPNYIGLAHSQELVNFSYAYEKNKPQALAAYKHFQQPNQGMQCFISGQVKHTKLELKWSIESPIASYELGE